MWIRSAFFIGRARDGVNDEWRAAIDGELIPAYRNFPGVRSARACWPQRRQDSPPNVACQLLIEFDTESAIDAMHVSPQRAALRPRVQEIMKMFEGSVGHIDYEIG